MAEAAQKEFIDYATKATPDASSFLKWAKESKLCKVNAFKVPEGKACPFGSHPYTTKGIFPSYIANPELHDIKVDPYGMRGKKKGPRGTDDAVYKGSEEARRRVARGNTILTFQHGGKTLACVPIWALKKFTGGIGDEDDFEESTDAPEEDSTPTWHRFFTRNPNDAVRVVSTQKANGAAGHLAVLKVGPGLDGYVWVGGSKNVHLVISKKEDLEKYTESRFTVAVAVVRAAWEEFHQPGKKLEAFLDMLWQRHVTACFELLDPEDAHIEDLSYLEKPELQLYSLVSFEKGVKSAAYICENPEKTYSEIAAFGLRPVVAKGHDLKPPSTRQDVSSDPVLMKVVDETRRDWGNEGRVLYFLDETGNVIGLLKKKTVWYIAIRAIREKLKAYYQVDFAATDSESTSSRKRAVGDSWEPFSPNHYLMMKTKTPNTEDKDSKTLSATLANVKRRMTKRVRELARWLGWGPDTTEAWRRVGVSAAEWVAGELGHGRPKRTIGAKEREEFFELMKGKFPVMWNQFKQASGLDDRIALDDAIDGVVDVGGDGGGAGDQVVPVSRVDRESFLEAEEGYALQFSREMAQNITGAPSTVSAMPGGTTPRQGKPSGWMLEGGRGSRANDEVFSRLPHDPREALHYPSSGQVRRRAPAYERRSAVLDHPPLAMRLFAAIKAYAEGKIPSNQELEEMITTVNKAKNIRGVSGEGMECLRATDHFLQTVKLIIRERNQDEAIQRFFYHMRMATQPVAGQAKEAAASQGPMAREAITKIFALGKSLVLNTDPNFRQALKAFSGLFRELTAAAKEEGIPVESPTRALGAVAGRVQKDVKQLTGSTREWGYGGEQEGAMEEEEEEGEELQEEEEGILEEEEVEEEMPLKKARAGKGESRGMEEQQKPRFHAEVEEEMPLKKARAGKEERAPERETKPTRSHRSESAPAAFETTPARERQRPAGTTASRRSQPIYYPSTREERWSVGQKGMKPADYGEEEEGEVSFEDGVFGGPATITATTVEVGDGGVRVEFFGDMGMGEEEFEEEEEEGGEVLAGEDFVEVQDVMANGEEIDVQAEMEGATRQGSRGKEAPYRPRESRVEIETLEEEEIQEIEASTTTTTESSAVRSIDRQLRQQMDTKRQARGKTAAREEEATGAGTLTTTGGERSKAVTKPTRKSAQPSQEAEDETKRESFLGKMALVTRKKLLETVTGEEEVEKVDVDAVADKFVGLMRRLHQPAMSETRDAIAGLLDVMSGFNARAVPWDPHLDVAMRELQMLLSRFANNRPVEPLIAAFQSLQASLGEREEMRMLWSDAFDVLRRSVSESRFVHSKDFQSRARTLAHRIRSHVVEEGFDAYEEDLRTIVREADGFLQGLASDPLSKRLGEDTLRLRNALFIDSNTGRPTFKTALVMDITHVILPMLWEDVKFIPIPRVEHKSRDWHIIVENIVLTTENIFPNLMELKVKNSVLFGLRPEVGTVMDHSFTLNFYQIQADVRDMPFFFRKKTGFPQVTDWGVANFFVGGEGITVKTKIGLDLESEYQTIVPQKVVVSVENLDLQIVASRNDAIYKVLHSTIVSIIRKELAALLGRQVLQLIANADEKITALKVKYVDAVRSRQMGGMRMDGGGGMQQTSKFFTDFWKSDTGREFVDKMGNVAKEMVMR
ncbi:hypothetical protein HDU96_006644 [Phlyctochytrium bullatum]|nr:hypothetical protein HDU96_006644 [Phlyctochytrium bullatum]